MIVLLDCLIYNFLFQRKMMRTFKVAVGWNMWYHYYVYFLSDLLVQMDPLVMTAEQKNCFSASVITLHSGQQRESFWCWHFKKPHSEGNVHIKSIKVYYWDYDCFFKQLHLTLSLSTLSHDGFKYRYVMINCEAWSPKMRTHSVWYSWKGVNCNSRFRQLSVQESTVTSVGGKL